MTRYLSSLSLDTLLADLANNGFVFESPEPFQVVHHEGNDAIYLGHIPIDDVGTLSEEFCANVTTCAGMEFETEIPEPTTPYNKFA